MWVLYHMVLLYANEGVSPHDVTSAFYPKVSRGQLKRPREQRVMLRAPQC